MNKIASIAFIVAGVLLLIWGVDASHSVGSNTAEAITGAPANKTIWLIVGGIILTLSGLAGFVFPRRRA